MVCPKCQHHDTRIYVTKKHGCTVERYRHCLACHQRFITYESSADIRLIYPKPDHINEAI